MAQRDPLRSINTCGNPAVNMTKSFQRLKNMKTMTGNMIKAIFLSEHGNELRHSGKNKLTLADKTWEFSHQINLH